MPWGTARVPTLAGAWARPEPGAGAPFGSLAWVAETQGLGPPPRITRVFVNGVLEWVARGALKPGTPTSDPGVPRAAV